MIFKKGNITASIDVLINDLGVPASFESIKSYTLACLQGSNDTTTEVIIPILFVVANDMGPDSVIEYKHSFSVEVAKDIVFNLNRAYKTANLKFVLTNKISATSTDSGGVIGIDTTPFVDSLPNPMGLPIHYSVATEGFRASTENGNRKPTIGVHQEDFLDLLKNTVDINSILTIVLVSALNNTHLGGTPIFPLSQGPYPGTDRPSVGFLPFYSLTDGNQSILGINYENSNITVPTYEGGAGHRHMIYVNLIGSMLGLLPTYVSDYASLKGDTGLAECNDTGCVSTGGAGDCMSDITPYVGETTLWSTLLLDNAESHASTCGDTAHPTLTGHYVSGDNVMSLRVDMRRSIWSPAQISFIRGSLATTGSPWNSFASTALEYTTIPVIEEVDPCAEVVRASVVRIYTEKTQDMSLEASSILAIIKKIQLLCNNILNR